MISGAEYKACGYLIHKKQTLDSLTEDQLCKHDREGWSAHHIYSKYQSNVGMVI